MSNKGVNQRKTDLKSEYQLAHSDDELIKEYFVEIFSWTALDIWILFEINKIKINISEHLNQADWSMQLEALSVYQW